MHGKFGVGRAQDGVVEAWSTNRREKKVAEGLRQKRGRSHVRKRLLKGGEREVTEKIAFLIGGKIGGRRIRNSEEEKRYEMVCVCEREGKRKMKVGGESRKKQECRNLEGIVMAMPQHQGTSWRAQKAAAGKPRSRLSMMMQMLSCSSNALFPLLFFPEYFRLVSRRLVTEAETAAGVVERRAKRQRTNNRRAAEDEKEAGLATVIGDARVSEVSCRIMFCLQAGRSGSGIKVG
ncbi:hypothetical protein J3F83DRAFT_720819 [Trichoderma novae-zelandiae]